MVLSIIIGGTLIHHLIQTSLKTVEKPASEKLMENVHPAGFAAGRNPEE
jgi:hypothetical protein